MQLAARMGTTICKSNLSADSRRQKWKESVEKRLRAKNMFLRKLFSNTYLNIATIPNDETDFDVAQYLTICHGIEQTVRSIRSILSMLRLAEENVDIPINQHKSAVRNKYLSHRKMEDHDVIDDDNFFGSVMEMEGQTIRRINEQRMNQGVDLLDQLWEPNDFTSAIANEKYSARAVCYERKEKKIEAFFVALLPDTSDKTAGPDEDEYYTTLEAFGVNTALSDHDMSAVTRLLLQDLFQDVYTERPGLDECVCGMHLS